MEKIIVTTQDELTAIIEATVIKLLEGQILIKQEIPSDKFLTIDEAADYLNLAKQTLYGFTSKNLIPHIKRAKRILFLRSDLDKWLLEGRKSSRQEINEKLRIS